MSPSSTPSPQVMTRAMNPPLRFGRDLLSQPSRGWGRYLVLTMPEPWRLAESRVAAPPIHVHHISSMDREIVERVTSTLPMSDTIVGLGGGMAMDMAKYVAWKRGLDPVLVPTIASVDACVTPAIGVRDGGKVHYVGFVAPQIVLVDFDLMQSAPPNLNRAGVGDIISIHTGLWDWKAGADRGLVAFVEDVARQSALLVDQLEALSKDVYEVTEVALQWLIEAYAAENKLCLQVGHSQPQEGSEHFFAYNIEHRTGRGYIHGDLVGLGTLLMSRLQGNRPERVARILQQTGVRFQPRQLGLSQADVQGALATLPAYVEAEKLTYSVVRERGLDDETIRAITEDLVY